MSVEWGGTGADSIEADPFNTYTPTIYFRRRLGDLPTRCHGCGLSRSPVKMAMPFRAGIPPRHWADPDIGEATADTELHSRVLNWGGTIQYSMPYLKSAVIDLGLPDFVNHLIPLVEATLQTPLANTLTSGTLTTGTINPGVLWVGKSFQVGVEALVPINRQSGSHVGVIAQLHLYLDDIDPHGIGKPIFGDSVQPARPFPRN